jgi:hypothetical protein
VPVAPALPPALVVTLAPPAPPDAPVVVVALPALPVVPVDVGEPPTPDVMGPTVAPVLGLLPPAAVSSSGRSTPRAHA